MSDKQIVGKATAYYNTRRKYILFNNAEMSQSFQAKAGDLDKKDVLDTMPEKEIRSELLYTNLMTALLKDTKIQ